METPAIKIENVTKRFGKIQAVSELSLQVQPGQIYGLLGANGAGKTTLLRLISGATRPNSGQLAVLGLHPMRQRHTLRTRFGYMPQTPALYEDLTPIENITFFGRAQPQPDLKRRVAEVLDFVGLTERARQPVHGFSGGMKQRVSLACALVHRPPLLLLDEPSAGVDPKLRAAFWQHFRDLAAGGTTILLSTHQMDEVLHCDRVAVLRAGEILAEDTPQNLLWRGQARLKVWQGGQLHTHTLSDVPAGLPPALQAYGLAPDVSRIELETDTLETIILNLIDEKSRHA